MKQLFLKTVFLVTTIVVFSGCLERVKEISVKGADGKEYTSYRTACSHGDYDAAREYVEKMKNQLTNAKANDKGTLKQSIEEAEDYIFNEEIQYLASLNEEAANNRVILILNQKPIEGVEAAKNTCLAKDFYANYLKDKALSKMFVPTEIQDFRDYIAWCGKHNSQCSSILGIAIACGNESLAKKILHSFRPDPEMRLENSKKKDHDGYYDVYAHYTNASKEAAQKKYDEAVKSGAFN